MIGDNGAGKSTFDRKGPQRRCQFRTRATFSSTAEPVNFTTPIHARDMPASKPSTRRLPCHPRCRLPTTCSWAGNSGNRASWARYSCGNWTGKKMEEVARAEAQRSSACSPSRSINQAVETLVRWPAPGGCGGPGCRIRQPRSSSWTNRRRRSVSRRAAACSI